MWEMLFVESVAQEVYGEECSSSFPPQVLCKHFQTLVYGEAPHPLWQNSEKQKCWNTRVVFIQNIGLLNQLCPFFFHLLTKLQGVQLQIYSVCQSMCGKMPWWSSTECGDSLPLDYGFNPQHLATASIKWSFRSLWATLVSAQKICLMLVFLLVATDDIILVMDPCTAGGRCKWNS